MQQQVWPTEDYEAALSYVPIEPVEDDLFAGLPPTWRPPTPWRPQGDLQIAYDAHGT